MDTHGPRPALVSGDAAQMSIVLPIVFFSVCLGLFVPRFAPRHWIILAAWIAGVLAYNFFKQ